MTLGRKQLAQSYESSIKRIQDVISATVTVNEQGGIDEIHVLAESKRTAKQIVRDIETFLRIEHNLEIDHKKISIVQLHEKTKLELGNRLQFKRINITLQGSQIHVQVELSSPEGSFTGEASGFWSKSSRLRPVAEASLKAVAASTRQQCSFILEDIDLITLGGQKIVVLLVSLVEGNGEEQVVGAAITRQDEKEAVVRAALDAVNRRLSFYKK